MVRRISWVGPLLLLAHFLVVRTVAPSVASPAWFHVYLHDPHPPSAVNACACVKGKQIVDSVAVVHKSRTDPVGGWLKHVRIDEMQRLRKNLYGPLCISVEKYTVAHRLTTYVVHLRKCIGQGFGCGAVERERLATDRLLAANTRATSAVAALEEVRARLMEVQATAEKEHQERLAAEARAQSLADQLLQVGPP